MPEYRVLTPGRLHFGLLAGDRPRGRSFGGAGLMIEAGGVDIVGRTRSSEADLAIIASDAIPKSLCERARTLAERLAETLSLPSDQRPIFQILDASPEHVGLGTGTQLSLAMAWITAQFAAKNATLERLARWTGRGQRSAIGIHGFAHGGLLVDGGKAPHSEIAPLICRLDFPSQWRVLLIRPANLGGMHGAAEAHAFQRDVKIPPSTTERLSKILLLELLPAVAEKDIKSLGSSLREYNRIEGECFATVQGGTFASLEAEQIIDWLGRRNVGGGQSSWGPTIFAVCESETDASALRDDLLRDFSLPQSSCIITSARNEGASLLGEDSVGCGEEARDHVNCP